MSHIRLQCADAECAAQFAPDMARLRCAECGSTLDVAYIAVAHDDDAPSSDMPSPLHSPADAVALGEGSTPSVRLRALGDLLGLEALLRQARVYEPHRLVQGQGDSGADVRRQRVWGARSGGRLVGQRRGVRRRIRRARRHCGAHIRARKRARRQAQPD